MLVQSICSKQKLGPVRGPIITFPDKSVTVDSSNDKVTATTHLHWARKPGPYLNVLFLSSNREGLNLTEFPLAKSVKEEKKNHTIVKML